MEVRLIAMTDSKYASCRPEDYGNLIRFRIFHLVEVGGEADEVEDGGGDKDVEEHTKQLPSQGHRNLYVRGASWKIKTV